MDSCRTWHVFRRSSRKCLKALKEFYRTTSKVEDQQQILRSHPTHNSDISLHCSDISIWHCFWEKNNELQSKSGKLVVQNTLHCFILIFIYSAILSCLSMIMTDILSKNTLWIYSPHIFRLFSNFDLADISRTICSCSVSDSRLFDNDLHGSKSNFPSKNNVMLNWFHSQILMDLNTAVWLIWVRKE